MATLAVAYVALVWLVVPVLPPLPLAGIGIAVAATIGLGIARWAVSRRFDNHDDVRPSVLAARPRFLYRFVAATFGAYVILAVIGAVLQPDQEGAAGQPVIVGGHPYLSMHGDLVPVSEAEYRHDLRIDDMSFLSLTVILNLANLFNLAGSGKATTAKKPRTRSL